MASELPTSTATSTQSQPKKPLLFKKLLTVTLGVICAVGMAIGFYGAHSDTFQHNSARFLAELANASGIHVKFTARKNSTTAPSGLSVDGFFFPKTSSDGSLSFDGRLTYTHIGSQYNFTLLDSRGYVTVQDGAGNLERNDCLRSENIPPISTFTDALLDARVIDDGSAFDIQCTDGKLVEFIFAGEPYVFCSSSGSSVDSIQGEDLEASIQLLTDNTGGFPSIDSLSPSGLDLSTCETLDTTVSTSSTSARRLMSKAIQRTKDTVQVIRGEPRRSLASMADCSCKDGMKACLFVHGYSNDDGELTSTSTTFGDIYTQANCCSSSSFIHLDTKYKEWYNDELTDKLCTTALEVSGSTDLQNIENIAIVAHSMGNMILSSAIMKGTCKLATSSKWISLAGPIYGSATASTFINIFNALSDEVKSSLCTDDGTTIDNLFYNLLAHYGLCPTMESIQSMALAGSSASTSSLDALYVTSGKTFGQYVTSSLCAVNYVGLVSSDSAAMALAGVLSGHASSANDGVVEISSCHATLSDSKYTTSWDGGNFYKASINHLDASFRNGDGWWGSDRKPIKWFNCQF